MRSSGFWGGDKGEHIGSPLRPAYPKTTPKRRESCKPLDLFIKCREGVNPSLTASVLSADLSADLSAVAAGVGGSRRRRRKRCVGGSRSRRRMIIRGGMVGIKTTLKGGSGGDYFLTRQRSYCALGGYSDTPAVNKVQKTRDVGTKSAER